MFQKLNRDQVMTRIQMNKNLPITCSLTEGVNKDSSIPIDSERQEKLNHLLLDAVYEGDIELVKESLKQGAWVDFEGPGEVSPLHVAAVGRSRELVNLLIDHGAKIMNQDQLNDWLFRAVLHNKIRPTKIAIKSGADVNVEDEEGGETPLHCAAYWGNIEIVKVLLENGAEVNHQTKDGKTPLYCAEKGKQKETVNLLKQHGGVVVTQDQLNEELFAAVEANDIEAVKQAIEEGAEVNSKNRYGNTPLHWSAEHGHTEIVKLLIENAANVNDKDEDGIIPLQWATWSEYADIVSLLKQHGGVL